MGTGGPSQQLVQQVMAKRAEIQELNEQLAQIQQSALEANPGLARQRDELVALVEERMAEAGHDPAASREKLDGMRSRLEGGDLSEGERQELSQAYRREVNTLRQVQGEIMQDESLQTKRQALNEKVREAMQEQNPQTERLIAELQSVQQEYQELASRAMQR